MTYALERAPTRRRPSLLDLLEQRAVTLRPLARPSPRLRGSMLALDRAIRASPRPRFVGACSNQPSMANLSKPLALKLALDQSQREITPDGHLKVHRTILSEARVDDYISEEIPDWQQLGLPPGKRIPLLRHPAELQKSVPSMNSLPLLVGHRPVSAEDHPHELVVGCTGTDAEFDGRYLWNSLTIWSAPAIDAVESGELSDISMGYRYVPIPQEGVFNGRKFAGIMTELVGNHASLVSDGRVPSARVAK